jgi:hypothetical protein
VLLTALSAQLIDTRRVDGVELYFIPYKEDVIRRCILGEGGEGGEGGEVAE